MIPASEMEQNVVADNSIDPTYFNFIDVGNSAASPDDQHTFSFFDDLIKSTEEASDSVKNDSTASTSENAQSAEVQDAVAAQPPAQQQLLQNVLQQQQQQQQQQPPQQPPSVGNVIMAMGQPSQAQTIAVAGSDSGSSHTQLLQNQAAILPSNVGNQQLGSSFIFKASTPIQLVSTTVTQSTSTHQQFLPTASTLITPSQSSSPLLSRSITPNVPISATTITRPASVQSQPPSALSSLNLLQLQQSPHLAQQLLIDGTACTAVPLYSDEKVPLSNLVANQQSLQGHAVLTAQGSNIVHTQNALIQNPNVVNVNVAHVLSNQLPQLQGTIFQTAQGKYLIQPTANNQQLPQQLCLGQVAGAQPVQMAGTQPVHVAGGQPVQLASGQTVQMAPNVGLGQPTVIAQTPSNVALANNSGVGQQQASYNLINLPGQGPIVFQRTPSSNTSVSNAQPLTQGPFLLRTVNGQQQLLPQTSLQTSATTTQLPQQLVAQTGNTQNIPIQQLLSGAGAQPLRFVGQVGSATAQPAAINTTTAGNIILQPIVTGNQVRFVGQQTPTQKTGAVSEANRWQKIARKPDVSVSRGAAGYRCIAPKPEVSVSQGAAGYRCIARKKPAASQRANDCHIKATLLAVKGKPETSRKKKICKKPVASQGADGCRNIAPTTSKSGTVTLSLGGQNLSLQPFQGIQGLQLTTAQQQQQVLLQQQQQQTVSTTVQQTIVPAVAPQVASSSTKKTKKPTSSATASISTASTSMPASSADSLHTENILSAALASSGILDDDSFCTLVNGCELADSQLLQLDLSQDSSPSTVQSTPTPPPPVPTPPASAKNKSKKKKKEVSSGAVQPVVLSSTTAKSNITLTTASATVVTTTVSQSAMSGQVTTNTILFSSTSLMSMTTQSLVVTTASQPAVSATAVAETAVTMSSTFAAGSLTSLAATAAPASTIPVKGRHGPPNLTVKPTLGLQSMSATDKQNLATIHAAINKLKEQSSQDQNNLALMQQLDMKRKKILAAHQTQSMAAFKQQQQQQRQTSQATVQGQQVTVQTQPDTGALQTEPLLSQTLQSQTTPQSGASSQVSIQPATSAPISVDLKPLVGTSTTPLLQIQPKSNAKLTLLSPKVDPNTPSKGVVSQEVKPVLMAGTVQTVQNTQGTTYQTSTGNVIMTMSNPPTAGQTGSAQPQVLRIQIGGQKSQTVAVTAAAVTTTAQQVVVQSPQKIVMATNVATTLSSTGVAQSPAVSHVVPAVNTSPNQARPVQIKIANQLLMLQLTQQQQEKLELHLSRMTLEQQQAFLRQQHHILTKLQHRVESHASGQPTALQASATAAGSSVQGAAAATAPTLVAAVSNTGEGAANTLNIVAPASTQTATPAVQQLPVTVQALVNSQAKSDSTATGTVGSSPATRHISLDIPKSSMVCSQLKNDQKHALEPNMKSPYKDNREACRRLLRYHVFQSNDPSKKDLAEFDENFTHVAEDLMDKQKAMNAKLRLLLMQDSMRVHATSETVMVDRMWCNDMQVMVRQERELIESDQGSFIPMPKNYLERDLSKKVVSDSEEDSEGFEEDSEDYEEVISDGEASGGECCNKTTGKHTDNFCAAEGTNMKKDQNSLGKYRGHSPSFMYQGGDRRHEKEAPLGNQQSNGQPEALGLNKFFETSPQRDSYPVERSQRKQSSSPSREGNSSFLPELSHSSPPHTEPPPRTVVKLVIRNDGKGFTSKFVENGETSVPAEGRTLRSRSHSGHERPEETKRVKKEPVTEEIEYIDIDNSKYNKGVSVKLERLPERTSLEYGLNIGNKASSSGVASGSLPQKTCGYGRASSENTSLSSSKSSRKRRRVGTADNAVVTKQERRYSGHEVGSDNKGESLFRDMYEPEVQDRPNSVQEFYVGSAMESLDHFDSDDDEFTGYSGVDNSSSKNNSEVMEPSRKRPLSSSPIPSSRNSYSHPPSDMDTQAVEDTEHPVFPYQLGSEGEAVQETYSESSGQLNAGPSHQGDLSFVEYLPDGVSPMDHQGTQPTFTEQVTGGLIDKLFDSSPGHAMETPFDLDNADPQRSMINSQVQSAIDSVLNCSGSSEKGYQQRHHRIRSSQSYSSAVGDDVYADYSENMYSSGRSGLAENRRDLGSGSTSLFGDNDSEPDLDAAIESILK